AGGVAAPLFSQSTESSILGNVRDSGGAVIPGAKVVLLNEGSNDKRVQTTNSDGDYRFSGILNGSYRVTVEANGFKTLIKGGITVDVSQIRRVDAKLDVGDVSTSVTVQDTSAAHIDTESATQAVVSTARDFAELPMSVYGRAWINVAKVAAGVQSNSGVEVNGARDTANNYTSDGLSANDIVNSRQTPNGFSGDIEAFQEMKVSTANNSAEFAQVAQFSAVSKSGENTPHAGFFWGNYNSFSGARAWQDKTSPSFENFNQFTAMNGGPVYLPHLYNGKNRTFYYFTYGGARYRTGARYFTSVPTDAFRNGDFSSLLGSIPILDPLTGKPFPGNVIPSSRISAVASAWQSLIYPHPNLSGQGALGLVNNYYTDPGAQFNADNVSVRIDHKFSDRNYFFARVGLTIHNQDANPGPLLSGYGGTGDNDPGRSFVVSDTHILTASLVNEFKAGYSSTSFDYWGVNNLANVVGKIGLQGINNPGNDPSLAGMPDLEIGGANGFQGTTSTGYSSQTQNTYQITDNLSWNHNGHNFKAGVDIRRYQVNDQNKPQNITGSVIFDDQLSGFAYANFLLGLPSNVSLAIARPNAYIRSTQQGYYIQDEFKVSPRLTLTYGLRYEYQSPWIEKFNRMTSFDLKTGSIVTAGSSIPTDLVPAVAATLPIISASSAGLPTQSLMRKDDTDWGPRFGLAYRPFGDDMTVFRMGYGVFTSMWPGLLGLGATGGPWQSNQSWYIVNNQPSISFPNPFQSTVQGFAGVQKVNAIDPDFPHERTQQWNASIGRQIWKTGVDIAYVGTRGTNIPFYANLNLLPPSTTPFTTASLPYPLFSSVGYNQTGSLSSYNGLTIKADRRVTRGLTVNANYTLAKELDEVGLNGYLNAPAQNQYNRHLERGDDPAVRRHTLIFFYTYELPFGHGKQFLGTASGVFNKLVSGWQIAGTTLIQSGPFLSPSFSGVDPTNTNQFSGRPDRIGDGNTGGSLGGLIDNHQPIFNRSAFLVPASGRGYYGNSARSVLVGPSSSNWNAIVAKNFYLFSERARAQLRCELYNAFNHPNFSSPSTNISSSSFGLVTSAASGRRVQVSARFEF
ncbi:MAG TPA: TonB-dependent receptor, partial [Bryobacteraceae bacterium]